MFLHSVKLPNKRLETLRDRQVCESTDRIGAFRQSSEVDGHLRVLGLAQCLLCVVDPENAISFCQDPLGILT